MTKPPRPASFWPSNHTIEEPCDLRPTAAPQHHTTPPSSSLGFLGVLALSPPQAYPTPATMETYLSPFGFAAGFFAAASPDDFFAPEPPFVSPPEAFASPDFLPSDLLSAGLSFFASFA